MNENEKQLSIAIPEKEQGGKYSNLAIISHSHTEFIIDFAQMLPGLPKANVCSRIIMAPEHAKRLMSALIENINKYEAQFGTISIKNAPNTPNGTLNIADLLNNGNGSKS